MSSDEPDNEWMASGDRSDPALQMIDNELVPTLTYDGYQDNIKELEAAFFGGGNMTCAFVNMQFKIREKQKMHEGDRTHPQLLQLDQLRCNLNYDGWEEDFRQAEETHLESGFYESHQMDNDSFLNACTKLERRQAMSDGDRSHPWLKKLDSLCLTFSGWETALQKMTERYYIEGHDGYLLEHALYTLEERQRVHEGDRSSPRLVALDNLKSRLIESEAIRV